MTDKQEQLLEDIKRELKDIHQQVIELTLTVKKPPLPVDRFRFYFGWFMVLIIALIFAKA